MMGKVLFVCTANLQRSPTAEDLFQGWRGRWDARSAGVRPVLGRNPLTQSLIDWADIIIVMEPTHAHYIHAHFKCDSNKIRVLGIPDIYFRNDPELIKELERKVVPILDLTEKVREKTS